MHITLGKCSPLSKMGGEDTLQATANSLRSCVAAAIGGA
jgi:hypothetical protein